MAQAQPPDQAARRRGLITILVDTLLMWGGFFMVVPLISVYYVGRLGWAATAVGLVLAVRQLTQQGLTPLSGVVADRFGAKWLICAGMLIRAVGFASMAWAHSFWALLGATVLAALGGSLFESPRNAAVAALTDETNRTRIYSLAGVVAGLGVTLGTQAGALLLPFDFALVALIAAGCFVAAAAVTAVFLPSVRVAADGEGLTSGLRLALRDQPFMLFNLLLVGYWFIWVQFSISLPLAAEAIGGTTAAVGWIYAINSGMAVLLGYPLPRLAERWLRPLPMLICGILLMAAGLGGLALAHSVPMLLGCVAFISLGTVLTTPGQQAASAGLSNPTALGSYFGVNSLALAIGGGLGNLSGGLLYDTGRAVGLPALPWVAFSVVGLGSAAGFALLARRLAARRGTAEASQMGQPAALRRSA